MEIWEALSNFYLDTELNEKDYDYISNILLKSKLSYSELKAIDLHEVFPTLQLNLLSPAGEWSGFETAWLNAKCMYNHEKRISSKSFRLSNQLKNALHFWMRKKHWQEIERRMKER